MILGVVLGNIAELNLSRSLAIDDNLLIFVTRPWSLFFLLTAAYSLAFPWYQKLRGEKIWTQFYLPSMLVVLAVPLFMMNGVTRPIIGAGLLAAGCYMLWRSIRNVSDRPGANGIGSRRK